MNLLPDPWQNAMNLMQDSTTCDPRPEWDNSHDRDHEVERVVHLLYAEGVDFDRDNPDDALGSTLWEDIKGTLGSYLHCTDCGDEWADPLA